MGNFRRISLASAAGRRTSTAASTTSEISASHQSSRSFPAMIRRVEQILDQPDPQPRIALDDFDRARGARGPSVPPPSSRAQPRIALSGVRGATRATASPETGPWRGSPPAPPRARPARARARLAARRLGARHRDRVTQATCDPVGAERLLREIVDRAGAHQLHGEPHPPDRSA